MGNICSNENAEKLIQLENKIEELNTYIYDLDNKNRMLKRENSYMTKRMCKIQK